MTTARVVSTGSYLPGDPITNEDLERLVGPLPPDILEGIQVKRRHWMIDPVTGEHRTNNSAMATSAVREALANGGVDVADVDLIVSSTASPEYHLPPMVTLVQELLGIPKCATIELRSGCAGFVEAFDVARMYVERGTYHTAVVVGSEAISPLLAPVYLGKDPERIRMRDRMNPYNFGDGAGAVVLQADAAGGGRDGVFGGAIASVGGERQVAMQVIGGGTHRPIHEQLEAKLLVELKVDVVASGEVTPHVLTEALADVLQASGITADEVDVCVIPEGNAGYMVEELKQAGLLTPEWLALEGKIFENLTDVGATGSAAVPLALDVAWKTGRLKPGDRVMILAIETSKWKYAGSMLTWTAAPYAAAPAAADAGVTAP
jgi:3-oxoacyl-[acyl-carrier-protein] synthase III